MKRLLSVIMALTLSVATLQAQTENKKVVADWEGTLEVQAGVKLRIRFHIKEKEGKLEATMDSVDQNAFGHKFDEVTYKDGVLTLKISVFQGTYTGKLDGKELKGKWKQGPNELDLNMKKMPTS